MRMSRRQSISPGTALAGLGGGFSLSALLVLLGLIVLALVPAMPASAAKPEAVTITTTRVGPPNPGTFSASGAISDTGTFTVQSVRFGGSDASGVAIVHATEVYVGQLGTFTISRTIRVTATDDPDVRAVTGTWAVLHGTEGYANLHGQGTITGVIIGDGPTETFQFTYTGQANMD